MPEAKTTPKKPARKKTAAKGPLSSSSMTTESQSPFKLEVLPKRTKRALIIIAVLVLLGIIIFLNRSLFIAGLVNGEPISRIEVIKELEKQSGAGVLNRLIDRKLIFQEAQKQNIAVTNDEIEAKRKEILDQVSAGNEENFKQILTAQGLSEETFREELRVQILVEKMLEGKAQVTDEEFNSFIQNNPDLIQNAEDEVQARAQLRDQLVQQKLQTEYNTWMEGLRNNGNVVRFVNY